MIGPAFVVFSTPRSGSTALYRALNLVPGVQAAYEPMFDDIELRPAAVVDRLQRVFTENSGFKHVYRPTGYPFRPVHDAPIEEMERNLPLWIELNSAILNFPNLRLVFLSRRNGFSRTVSDLVAASTDQWGASDTPVTAAEAALYKQTVARMDLPPLNETLLRWYLQNVPRMHHALRQSVKSNSVLDIWYEDFFGPEVNLRDRLARFRDLLDFLALPKPASLLECPELALLLRPSAKLNDRAIFERVPNYRELRARYDSDGASAPPPAPAEDDLPSPSSAALRFPGIDQGVGRPRLRCDGDNLAGLEFPPEAPDALRVAIARAVTGRPYDVQLNVPCHALAAGHSYQLRFRARAAKSRTIAVGFAQAHDPWNGLGFYEELALSSDWQEFQRNFTTMTGDEEARIHFDLGSCPVSVDLTGIRFIPA